MIIKEALFNLAKSSRKNSYSPYSYFKVGASIYCNNEKTYSGCNVENASYPCGTCAEAGAISAMIADGGKKIKEILILADSKETILPCGNCLQKISEFSNKNSIIHLANLKSIEKSYKLEDLLPKRFSKKDLKND